MQDPSVKIVTLLRDCVIVYSFNQIFDLDIEACLLKIRGKLVLRIIDTVGKWNIGQTLYIGWVFNFISLYENSHPPPTQVLKNHAHLQHDILSGAQTEFITFTSLATFIVWRQQYTCKLGIRVLLKFFYDRIAGAGNVLKDDRFKLQSPEQELELIAGVAVVPIDYEHTIRRGRCRIHAVLRPGSPSRHRGFSTEYLFCFPFDVGIPTLHHNPASTIAVNPGPISQCKLMSVLNFPFGFVPILLLNGTLHRLLVRIGHHVLLERSGAAQP